MTQTAYPCVQSFLAGRKSVSVFALFFLTVFIFGLLTTQPGFAKSNPKYASIVIDANTGLLLSQSNADKSLHPASLTKLMTLLIAFDALKSGRLHLRDRIRISRRAAGMVPSKLDLPAGSTIRVEDAIHALVTKSANDIALALAEHLGKTESNFAKIMTARGREIGMTRTTFRNASGLHNPGQVSTARDMARLARTLINEYNDYYHYFSKKAFTYRGKTYRNHNRLIGRYNGMDGMKTGYIQASGFNLVASAVRNNERLISVVFGGRTAGSRNAHTVKLLDRGFARMNALRVASARVPLPPRKPVYLPTLASSGSLSPQGSGRETWKTDGAEWAVVNPALQSTAFSRLIGEGDYDPAVFRRIETGLMAMTAHRNGKKRRQYSRDAALLHKARHKARPDASLRNNPRTTIYRQNVPAEWAIQIGAFSSRTATMGLTSGPRSKFRSCRC